MLTGIYCEAFGEQKTVLFSTGLNVIQGYSDEQDGNGNSIGKTNMLKIIDCAFGGKHYFNTNEDVVQHVGEHAICYGRQGYNENHGTKGISLTREDEESGYKGYDTVTLNWNQVQKRVRALIDSGQYLNDQEKAYLPVYEKMTLARRVYQFYSIDPQPNQSPRR